MDPMDDMKQHVELYISGRKLKDTDFFGKSDCKVKVFLFSKDKWVKIGKTEKIKDNLNPDFKKTIKTDYFFETKQPMKFEVYDVDKHDENDLIGSVQTSLGQIMGARKQTAILELVSKTNKPAGQLIVRGDKTGNPKNEIFWQWDGVKLRNTRCLFGTSHPFLRFSKERSGEWLKCYESKVIKENLNPVWETFKIGDDKLCDGDYNKRIKIECYDFQKNGFHRLIGECETTLEKIKNGEKTFKLANPQKDKYTGTLNVGNLKIEPKYTFVDYLRGGEQLSSIIAIDFTGSNGDPKLPTSLHARSPDGKLNEYEQAISSVCQIILNYDYDKKMPVFGFGAKPRFETLNSPGTSHCFPCTGKVQESEVLGLEGIMNVYRHALNNVLFAGPTYFAPIIREAMNACKINKQNEQDVYSILLILTDGAINDEDETINALREAAGLPLSVVIVGVGVEDFSKMEILDGEKGFPYGKKPARDLVQFVAFKKFNNDMSELAKNVLAEIPRHLVEYKKLVGKKPRDPLY